MNKQVIEKAICVMENLLEVDSSKLDQRLFCRDENQREENGTVAYKGIIPYEWLRVWNETE